MSGTTRSVLAIIGSGGMGLASARRMATGRRIFLADASEKNLEFAARSLRDDGHEVETQQVDVANFESVQKFAQAVASAGKVETVVHTAGLSPAMAAPDRILEVDLLGTANVIEAFQDVVGPGSSMTCIASIARLGLHHQKSWQTTWRRRRGTSYLATTTCKNSLLQIRQQHTRFPRQPTSSGFKRLRGLGAPRGQGSTVSVRVLF